MASIKIKPICSIYNKKKLIDIIPNSFITKFNNFLEKSNSSDKQQYIHHIKLIKKNLSLANTCYLICYYRDDHLNTIVDPTKKEILQLKINLTKRYIIRNRFIKIILKYLPIIDDPKSIIYSFIGIETVDDLFNVINNYDNEVNL